MHRRRSQNRSRDIMALGGWLFADLLLALAMLFFITSVDVRPVLATPTPKPTLPPHLEFYKNRLQLAIDAGGVLQNAPSAINDVKQQIRKQRFLQGRSVGFVIVYGGAPNVNQIGTAITLADKIYVILKTLGREWLVFRQASLYDSLYVLGGDFNVVTLDIYLFAKQ